MKTPIPVTYGKKNSKSGSTELVRQLQSLMSDPSPRVRGDWHHYTCLVCDDHSQHMGINIVTGQVKCLRCGFGCSVNTIVESKKRLDGAPKEDLHDLLSPTPAVQPSSPGTSVHPDTTVFQYMVSRGVGEMNRNGHWFYGRGRMLGWPVFIATDIDGNIVYLQGRNIINDGGPRYIGMRGYVPRLDCYPARRLYPSNTLVLTEGPISAISIRKHMNLWASPTWGADMKNSTAFINDVMRAARHFNIVNLIVCFDADKPGVLRGKTLAHTLRLRYRLNTAYVEWPDISDDDPASNITTAMTGIRSALESLSGAAR